jgi:hypothetical protein
MKMPNIDLFTWWTLSISFSTIFLTLISIYLFVESKSKRKEGAQKEEASVLRIGKSFAFVFVLLGLLVFYIFSIQLGTGVLSESTFIVGNIIVEALLVLYLLRNREKESENR